MTDSIEIHYSFADILEKLRDAAISLLRFSGSRARYSEQVITNCIREVALSRMSFYFSVL